MNTYFDILKDNFGPSIRLLDDLPDEYLGLIVNAEPRNLGEVMAFGNSIAILNSKNRNYIKQIMRYHHDINDLLAQVNILAFTIIKYDDISEDILELLTSKKFSTESLSVMCYKKYDIGQIRMLCAYADDPACIKMLAESFSVIED